MASATALSERRLTLIIAPNLTVTRSQAKRELLCRIWATPNTLHYENARLHPPPLYVRTRYLTLAEVIRMAHPKTIAILRTRHYEIPQFYRTVFNKELYVIPSFMHSKQLVFQ